MKKDSSKPPVENGRRVATSGDIEVSTYLEIAETGGETAPVSEALGGKRETIIVIDFGSQYSLLITRRIRECHVYCELIPYDAPWEQIAPLNPKGFILSGGPASVYDEDAPLAQPYIYESGLPVLGICYGMGVLARQLGGQVAPAVKREYGQTLLNHSDIDSPLFAGVEAPTQVWMSHGDRIESMPPGFRSLAYTENSPIAIMGNDNRLFGLQFHPEVVHTPEGKKLLKNFAYRICGCQGNWTMGNFINESV